MEDVTVGAETAEISATTENIKTRLVLRNFVIIDAPVQTPTVTIFPIVMTGGASPRAPGIMKPVYTATLASGHG